MDETNSSLDVFKTVAEFSSDWLIWMVDGRIVKYASPAAKTITGYAPEEFMADPGLLERIIYPEDKTLVSNEFDLGSSRTHENSIEFRILHKDGGVRWLSHRCRPVFDEEGTMLGRVSANSDITAGRKTRNALEEKDRLLMSVIDGIQDPLHVIDRDFRVVLTNRKLLEMRNIRQEDAVGKRCFEVYQDRSTPCEQCAAMETFETGSSGAHIHTLPLPDGTFRHLEVYAFPLVAQNGATTQVIEITHDITNREHAMRNIVKLAAIIEQATEAVAITDTDGILEYVNPAFEKITGYSREETVGQNPRVLKSGDLPPGFYRGIWETIKGGSTWKGAFINRRKNGEAYYEDAVIFPIRNDAGEIMNYVKISHDVTDLKNAENIRLAHEERLRTLINSTPDVICFKDGEGRWLEANDADLKLFQLEAVNYRGKTDIELAEYSPYYRDAFGTCRASDETTWLNGEISRDVETIFRPDGSKRVYDIIKAPLFEPDGSRKGLVVLGRDITETKNAEEALRESEKRYRRIFTESQEVIFVSSGEGRYIDMNPAGLKLFGYASLEELKKIDIACDVYKDPADRIRMMRKVTEQGYVKDYELVLKTKTGDELNVLLSSTLHRDARTGSVLYHGVIHDVTENKKLENQLVQSQKMEAIGTLAGGVAHDFNNLLTVINGYAEMAMLRIDDKDRLRHYISSIQQAGLKARNLAGQLLAFSRKQACQPEILDINEVILSLNKMVRRLLGEDIDIRTVLPDNLPKIKADNTQLEQIFVNLLVNARDALHATKQNGFNKKITIETGRLALDARYVEKHPGSRAGLHVFFSVSDNGAGMAKEIQQRIFEPFFTTKEKHKGTGLGLSTVYGIVKQNGGSIYVYSEPDRGTTFKILWPTTEETREGNDGQEKGEDDPLPHGSERVLVVEDEQQVRDYVCELLTALGYDVHEAENGRIALDILQSGETSFDLIITDVIMPEMGGRELIEKTSKLFPDMKVVFASGYEDNHIIHDGMLDEAINFLPKPYVSAQLAATIRRALDGNRAGTGLPPITGRQSGRP
jgi:PAS domain S-box-containing protein